MRTDTLSIALLACLSSGAGLAGSDSSLAGRYVYRSDAQSVEMLGGLVCFYPDGGSAKLLPRSESDRRLAWFCFRNDAQAKLLLGIEKLNAGDGCGLQGTAQVRIAEYSLAKQDSDDFDSALLRSVSHLSSPEPVDCE
jgi:hypothetical protein